MLRPLLPLLVLQLGLAAAQLELPSCRYDDLKTPYTNYQDWARTLLDPIYSLPADYAPPDLVSIDKLGLSGDHRVRSLMIEDLQALLEAAATAGVPLEIQSAYRSYDYQARTFTYWTEREGREAALRSSARAGHSEHQLGTAIDFRSAGGTPPWDLADWGQTPAGAWLAANGWRFGFVMSYPRGLEEQTCYIYEPWHYRYLGREAAQAVTQSGLPLRVWLSRSQPEP